MCTPAIGSASWEATFKAVVAAKLFTHQQEVKTRLEFRT
jgi:hypothetical protein